MNADELINAWALTRFRAEEFSEYDQRRHLQTCATAVAKPLDMGWNCSCYSEYTRNDDFMTYFKISCEHDIEYSYTFYSFEWNLPELFRELDEYRNNTTCRYWNGWD